MIEKPTFGLTGCARVEAIRVTERNTAALACFETDVCAGQSAVGLVELGFRAVVPEDATYTNSAREHARGLARMAGAGVERCHCKGLTFEWLHTVDRAIETWPEATRSARRPGACSQPALSTLQLSRVSRCRGGGSSRPPSPRRCSCGRRGPRGNERDRWLRDARTGTRGQRGGVGDELRRPERAGRGPHRPAERTHADAVDGAGRRGLPVRRQPDRLARLRRVRLHHAPVGEFGCSYRERARLVVLRTNGTPVAVAEPDPNAPGEACMPIGASLDGALLAIERWNCGEHEIAVADLGAGTVEDAGIPHDPRLRAARIHARRVLPRLPPAGERQPGPHRRLRPRGAGGGLLGRPRPRIATNYGWPVEFDGRLALQDDGRWPRSSRTTCTTRRPR